MIKPILKSFTCMDLRQIADSGQCFRMTELSDMPGRFSVISQERYLEIEQLECDWKQTDKTRFEAKTFAFYCKKEELSFWERYFDLDQDYEAYINSVRKRDSYLQHAAQAGSGIRILNQDPWEMILTFVISQQKTIPKIREAVEALSRQFGTEHRSAVLRGSQEKEITWHSFPTPSQLAEVSEETLRALGVTTPEIHLTADPALLIDPGDTPAIRSFLHHSGLADGTRYALFALRPWKDFDRHIAAFANAAEYAHREYGLTPVLYAMEPCRDRAALNAVAAQLRCPYLLLEAGSNGTEIVALIRRMSLVIAMRLHTLIFAAGQGVPMVGVVYDPKVSGFLDYLGQDLYLPLEEANAASLCDLIDTAMAEQMFEAENIRSLRELAAENEELARHLLTEE